MVYMYHSFLVHSSADGHLGCFHVLAMTNSAEMNIGVHVSLSDLVSLVCMPRSGIAGSYGSSISSFWVNCCEWHEIGILFHSFTCAYLVFLSHSWHQWCRQLFVHFGQPCHEFIIFVSLFKNKLLISLIYFTVYVSSL